MHSGTGELLLMKVLTVLPLAKSHAASSVAVDKDLSIVKAGLDK